MGMNLSISQLAIITISIAALVLGIVLISEFSDVKEITEELPTPFASRDSSVRVYPQSSTIGTVFSVVVDDATPHETQDLRVEVLGENFKRFVMLYDDGQHNDKLSNDGIYGGYFDSNGRDSGTYFIEQDGKQLTEFTITDAFCEDIVGNSENSKIKILVVPSGYTKLNEFRVDSRNIFEGENTLFEIEPFSSRKDEFSVTLATDLKDLECDIGCGVGARGIVCCNDNLVYQTASACEYDEILVLLDEDKSCGSASKYSKICARQSVAKLATVHELGHSFGGLADEYVYKDYSVGEINAPNCDAANTCDKWDEITSECHEGCTYSHMHRSSESSIMLTYVPYFNDVSQIALNKVINDHKQIDSEIELAAPEQKSYAIDLEYKSGSIILGQPSLKPIKSNLEVISSEYSVELEDNSGEIIYSAPLILPTQELPLPEEDNVPHPKTEFRMPLIIPYSSNGNKVNIKQNNELISQKSVSELSDSCGNNICEEWENRISCISDCKIESDNFCQSAICDPDCPHQNNCNMNNQIIKGTGWILTIISALIIIILLTRKTKNS